MIDATTAGVLNRKDTSALPGYHARALLAAAATQVATDCRYGGAPRITPDSGSEAIATWLQWCDPNGCHTAALATLEDCEPYDTAGAWSALGAMLEANS